MTHGMLCRDSFLSSDIPASCPSATGEDSDKTALGHELRLCGLHLQETAQLKPCVGRIPIMRKKAHVRAIVVQ